MRERKAQETRRWEDDEERQTTQTTGATIGGSLGLYIAQRFLYADEQLTKERQASPLLGGGVRFLNF
jgi:hypothetical protein